MKWTFIFVAIFAFVIVAVVLACKNKSGNRTNPPTLENEEMLQPPFDEQTLDADLQSAIKQYEPYQTATDIERVIADKELYDANSQLCYAYYTWLDLMQTNEYSDDALVIMDKSLEKYPNHSATLRFREEVKNKIDAATKKADQEFKRFYTIPVEKLTLTQTEDFAYYLSSYKTDKENLELEYKLWMKLYNEAPDKKTEELNGVTRTFYGNKYFYLGRATSLLWLSLEKHEEARPNFWRLINWPNMKDVALYRTVDRLLYYLLEEAIQQNNKQEFIRLCAVLKDKFQQINTYQSSNGEKEQAPILPSAFTEELSKYLVVVKDSETVKYIEEVLFAQPNGISKAAKENIAKARKAVDQ